MVAVVRACLAAGLGVALLVGCPAEEPPACPVGEVQDAETGECVPEHCGTEAWGLIERTGETIHVAPWGDDGWDGSAEWPYRTIQHGADEAGDGLVAVAAGTYVENLELDGDHDGVEIAGRCIELVAIDGSEQEAPGVTVTRGEVGIRGLAVAGGWRGVQIGALFAIARLVARDLALEGNHEVGLIASQAGTSVDLENVTVRDTQSLPDGTFGRGIEVQGGASLVARGLTLEENHDTGLSASSGGSVDLSDATIRDTQPRLDGTFGLGISVQDGANLVARGLLLEGNHSTGLFAGREGTSVELEETTVRDTQPGSNGAGGQGIMVLDGASLVARGLLLEGNHQTGLSAWYDATSVELEDATIRDTQPGPGGTEGRGIEVGDTASLVARGLVLEGNHDIGLIAALAGTSVDLQDTTIRDTQPSPDGSESGGLVVQDGASLVVRGLALEGNHRVGLHASDAGTSVDLQDATIRDTQPRLDGTQGRGIEVAYGAHLTGRGLALEGNRGIGLGAAHLGTTVEVEDVRIVGTREPTDSAGGLGVSVQEGASITAFGLQVEDNEGPGLYVVMGGTFEAWDATLDRNSFAAAVVLGGNLVLHGGAVSGSTSHPGEGGGVGVFGWDNWDPPHIEVDGVRFSDLDGPALYLRSPGRYVMRDCEVSDTGTSPSLPGGVLAVGGVEPWQEVGDTGHFTGLLLEGNTLSDLSGDAILLDSSSAILDLHPETGAPNTFVNLDGVPLLWQRCTDILAPEILDGSIAAPSCEPMPRGLGALLEYRLWLDETDPLE